MLDSLKSAGEPIRIEYVPRPGLGRLAIINFLLNLISLTIYRFWAKTNVRRHVWSCVHINGQPLEYTGRGMELFKGALIVFGLFLLPFVLIIALISIALGPEHPALLGVYFLLYLLIFLLWGRRSTGRGAISFRAPFGVAFAERCGFVLIYSLTYFGQSMARGIVAGLVDAGMNTVPTGTDYWRYAFRRPCFQFKGRAARFTRHMLYAVLVSLPHFFIFFWRGVAAPLWAGGTESF